MKNANLRFYIQTRTLLGITPKAVHQELVSVYGPEVLTYSTVQKCSKEFREGRMELEDAPRSGRLLKKILNQPTMILKLKLTSLVAPSRA